MSEAEPEFSKLRPGLIRLAYRMLGSVADAEDMVQDAYLRWLATDPKTVRQPAALLRKIVTRLCLNELTEFFKASRSGDVAPLRGLLADEVIAYSDGGGKVSASLRLLEGVREVMERHLQLASTFEKSPSQLLRYAIIDGLSGFITVEDGGTLQTTALQIEQGKITAIYVTRNPEKLRLVVFAVPECLQDGFGSIL